MAHDRPDILKRRKVWIDGQLDIDPEQLISIDKTWTLMEHGASLRQSTRWGTTSDRRASRALESHHLFSTQLSRTGIIAP